MSVYTVIKKYSTVLFVLIMVCLTVYPVIGGYINVIVDTQLSETTHLNAPCAIQDGDKVYIVWSSTGMDIYARIYNLTTASFESARQFVGTNPLTGDSHGAPSLVIDSSGYLHVFYGSHTTPLQYKKSSNPYDITSWDSMSSPVASFTYPNAYLLDNNSIFLWGRNGGHTANWIYKISSDGGVSWGGTHVIAESIDADYWYLRAMKGIGNTIHVTGCKVSTGSYDRFNQYYFFIDEDQYVYNISGYNISSLLPLDKNDMDSYCLVYDTGTDRSATGWIAVDGSNNPYISFASGTMTVDGAGTYMGHMLWYDSGVQVSDTGCYSDHLFDLTALTINASGYDFYMASNASIVGRGGNISHYHSVNKVSWSFVEDLANGTIPVSEQGLWADPKVVYNCSGPSKIVFYERSSPLDYDNKIILSIVRSGGSGDYDPPVINSIGYGDSVPLGDMNVTVGTFWVNWTWDTTGTPHTHIIEIASDTNFNTILVHYHCPHTPDGNYMNTSFSNLTESASKRYIHIRSVYGN